MYLFKKTGESQNQKKKILIFSFTFYFLLSTFYLSAQEKTKDSVKSIEEVLVSSVRATDKNPVTFTNVKKEEIAPRNLGQDIPVLLNYLPSVVTTTDAGAGIGYTYMRVRGADGSRINVTMNGIPFNDSESQGTFFVNLPDFASSLESIQLQRGVGTSTNGAGAFGASLNLQTRVANENPFAEISSSYGSFNSRKNSIAFSTGLNNHFELNARISQIHSDGYIERASSDMFGYYFNANYVTEKTIVKAIAFGGKEKTYQAWYGFDKDDLGYKGLNVDELPRNFNVAGIYFNSDGSYSFYDNETDNYWQNHFQLHWNQKLTKNWQSNIALHYTIGKGFYEQYKEDEAFADYSLNDFSGNTSTDLVRRRWLDNDFYGATFSLNYHTKSTDVLLGGAANRYQGKHFGEVIWTQYYVPGNNRYYNNYGDKDDVNVYAKVSQQISKLNVFADLQYRMVFYQANSLKFTDVNDTFIFFNPKIGVTYNVNSKNNIYVFAGIANKEPRRDDYENGSVKPEQLLDYELGWKYQRKNVSFNLNTFFMSYKDQLVMTGALNDVGAPIFTNSGKSYRVGVELEAQMKLIKWLVWSPNVTYSQNKNLDFYFQKDGVLTNLGNTNIAFSPSLIASNNLTFLPIKSLQLSILSKYVSEQFMGNIDSEYSKLPSYFINDFNASYDLKINKGIKSIVFSVLVNNLLNVEYDSNGYFYTYDDTWTNPTPTTIEGKGLYPQATRNFLAGIQLKF